MTAASSLTSSWSESAISGHETARAIAEAEQHADERRRAVWVIAGCSGGTDDARTLLDMLGLGLDDIRAARPLSVVGPDDQPGGKPARKGGAA